MDSLIIKSRDDKIFKIEMSDIRNMGEFMIKNMIEDTHKTLEIYINEDYEIIKSIFDSLRYNQLIFDKETNLNLMYCVCDKWCVPQWLINTIHNEIHSSKKLLSFNNFIDNLHNNIYKCQNCGVGFNKYNNKPDSCKFHICQHRTIANSNKYICCNKEEPCRVGYHVIDYVELNTILHTLKNIK